MSIYQFSQKANTKFENYVRVYCSCEKIEIKIPKSSINFSQNAEKFNLVLIVFNQYPLGDLLSLQVKHL